MASDFEKNAAGELGKETCTAKVVSRKIEDVHFREDL